MPSQGTKSTRMLVARWMPHALRALPRPDLLHRNHPMVHQSWRYMPDGFDAKVELLVDYLKQYSDERQMKVNKNKKNSPKMTMWRVSQKTLVYCNTGAMAAQLAEILATTHHFTKVGLFVSAIGNDERRERMRMLRDGRIRLMVCTDILSRGIDLPDIERIIQFDFSRNIVGHLHRIGRVSRAGTRGYALNMYDDDEQGGRAIAEAVQEIGSQPLDGLFSRNRGFKKGLRRTEAFRQMLLAQGLPLPPHLQDGSETEPTALLSENGEAGSEQKPVPSLLEALDGTEESFERTDEEKDEEFVKVIKDLDESRQQREDSPAEEAEEEEGGSMDKAKGSKR
uniref:Helicase C-terminal domain-containing protein n=1 Tax=Alexandrium catenella TaxID=2925 RepID=A0A7S1Q2P5_ALECA